MAITVYTEDEWFDAIMAAFTILFPTADLTDRGYFGLIARAFAQGGALLSQDIQDADNDNVPAYDVDADGNVRSRCSSLALDAWAFTFGLASGVPGIYGRRGATISTGGSGVPSGTATTFVPSGTQAVDSTGQIVVQTTADVTLNGPPNTNSVGFISVTTGTKANLPTGSLLTWVSPPLGLASTVALTSALVDAEDRETDVELIARLLRRIQTPPRGGTAADYRVWTEEAVDLVTLAQLGVSRAYVYPQRSGLGSVDVVPLQNGTGAGRIPGAGIIAKIQAYVNTKRPVTATVNILRALATDVNALRIRVRILPSTAKLGQYQFDWNDGGVSTGISAHNTGAKTISCTMPANLKAAVDAGFKPRIQIIDSAALATALPFQARVLSYVLGTPDVLTLDSFPTAGPVDGTDYFWAGGGAVDAVAANLLAFIDSLGPSRQSGFYDQYDAWQTDVTLAEIADVVMETKDADATRMISDIPKLTSTTAPGISIAVGAGSFAPNPYIPKDSGMGIELPFLRNGGIEVIKAQ